MKIIDKYILKQYFGTFLVLLLVFIPVSILIDFSERIEDFSENKVPVSEILVYYKAFLLTFFNILFPIFLFLSILWFTSRMAQNTEIIAILNGGMSFKRFVIPYFIGAFIIALTVVFLNTNVIPRARMTYNEFWSKYIYKHATYREKNNVYRQLDSTHYVFASSINHNSGTVYDFIIEEIDGEHLKSRLYTSRMKLVKDSTGKHHYRMFNVTQRIFHDNGTNTVLHFTTKDTILPFTLDDLTPLNYIAEGLPTPKLRKFIEKEKLRGSKNINRYLLEKYRRISLPVSAFILTFIAVAVASRKRRGGIGMNLALGIVIAFIYIFFDKIFGILSVKAGFSPFWAAWLPNIFFVILALYLLRNAQR